MHIAIVGSGNVGLSNAVILAQHNKVVAVDIDPVRVAKVNERVSPINDPELKDFICNRPLDLQATLDHDSAYAGADFVVVATPTDYDVRTHCFDTTTVERVIDQVLAVDRSTPVVIRSTVPVGFTEQMRREHPGATIIYCPEFLREERALHDNLHPSRIVIGASGRSDAAVALGKRFAELLAEGALDDDVPVLVTEPSEAEAIKLFANTYLALRVAYFNELDTYAATHGLDTRQIIDGVSLDPRIGSHYNNPSFGYGGYCLPKDTKQLQANFRDIPQNLISAVVDANATRKDFVAADILRRQPAIVGVFRLNMKSGSDNFRMTSMEGVLQRIMAKGVEVIVFEPELGEDSYLGCAVVQDLDEFKTHADVIIANRRTPLLADVAAKVYTRDIYSRDE